MNTYTYTSMNDFYAREPELWKAPSIVEALNALHTRHEDKVFNAAKTRYEVTQGIRESEENIEVTMYAWLRRFEHYSQRHHILDSAQVGDTKGRIILDMFEQIAIFEPLLSANEFIDLYRAQHHSVEPIHIFKFDQPRSEHLVHLVRERKKEAIATPLLLEDAAHFDYKVGDLVLITYDNHNAAALVRITESKISAFKDITRRFAYMTGEGDLSLEFFKMAKFMAFNRIYKDKGLEFNEDESIDLKTFKLVVAASDLIE